MGLYDTVLFVDRIDEVSCHRGHALRWFQTKDMREPSMHTYLVHHGRMYLAEAADATFAAEDDAESSRIEGDDHPYAVREHRFKLHEVRGPLTLRVYGSCKACEPVLVRRGEPGFLGDLVIEHAVFVDFRLSLLPGAPIAIERTSGTRDDLKADLRARGVYVLEDDEPLAIAHCELRHARLHSRSGTRRGG
jgi:hypothetical protein